MISIFVNKKSIFISLINIFQVVEFNTAKQKPKATDEVGYNDSNNNQSKDFINVKNHVLSHNFLISALISSKRLDHFLKPRNINQFNKSWETCQSQKFSNLPRRQK